MLLSFLLTILKFAEGGGRLSCQTVNDAFFLFVYKGYRRFNKKQNDAFILFCGEQYLNLPGGGVCFNFLNLCP